MKKVITLVLFVILCIGLMACNLSDNNSDSQIDSRGAQTILLGASQKEELFQGSKTCQSSYDSSYGVGRAVNALTDKYLEVTGRYTPVFDSTRFMELNWMKTKQKFQESEVISDTSATQFQLSLAAEYEKKMSTSIGVNGLFTAGLENDFSISNSTEITKDTKEVVAKLYQNINGFSVEIEGYNDYRNFYSALSEGFVKYLLEIRDSNYDTTKINNLFEFYGTHIVMAGYYGGRIECNYHLLFEETNSSNTTDIGYKSRVKAALEDAQYTASAGEETTYDIKNKIGTNIKEVSESFTYRGRGGTYFAGSSLNEFMDKYSTWVDSFNVDEDQYSVLIDIPDKSLMPIWLLIPEEYSDVSLAIEKAFSNKADYYYNQWLKKCAYSYKDNNNIVDFGGGEGSEENPYLIMNEQHLKNISKYINSGSHFKLFNDVTINNNRWTPLGTNKCSKKQDANKLTDLMSVTAFNGFFDGNNKTISYDLNMDLLNTVNDNDYSFGLFGLIRNAEIKDLTVNARVYGTNMTKGKANVAGLIAGWAIDSYFENCKTYGQVKQNHGGGSDYGCVRSGGQVGIAKNCNFNKCTNYADVMAGCFYATAGGIAGGNTNSKYVDCKNYGKIESNHGKWIFGGDNHGDLYGKV